MDAVGDLSEKQKLLTCILNELVEQYALYFGRSPSPFVLKIKQSEETNLLYPITYRSRKEIILLCPSLYPYQFYYQLSHELCHWMIPRDVSDKLRWLEEVIAVIAPPFFAPMIKSLDQTVLLQYLNGEFRDAVPVDFSSLFVPGSETITALENNRENFTDYSHYETISLKLLPTVQQHPAFWKAVPLLCDVEPAPDLKTSFDRWLSLVEDLDVHSSLSKVIGSLL